MYESDVLRQVLLAATGLLFAALALRSWWVPDQVAAELGYRLSGPNGYSELHAIYVGLWLAHAALAFYALRHLNQAILGDLLALLILAQPFGRLLALPRFGPPQGPLMIFFVLEIIGGLLLLAVRPG